MPMLTKRILNADRVRKITGGFSFIPHRFLADGFLASLEREEILLYLYLFLILAGDRHGLSCYSYDAICNLLQLNLDEYIAARDGLIRKDLIGFDGRIFQVFALPSHPLIKPKSADDEDEDPAVVAQIIRQSLRYADQRRALP
jgi:hypothetical protein